MDLCASDTLSLCSVIGAFKPIQPLETEVVEHKDPRNEENEEIDAWSRSFLNPRMRINSLEDHQSLRWIIDSADSQGTQFFIRPTFIDPLMPKSIAVLIPDQRQHPPYLRSALGSSWSFCIRDRRINGQGIATHLRHILEHWTQRVGEVKVVTFFRDAPFGSRIILENIDIDPRATRIRTIKDFGAERQMLSVESLQGMWCLPSQKWPPEVRISGLQLLQQIHDTVALVKMPSELGDRRVVFKSATHDLKYLYHELKLLLSLDDHSHVMPRPLFIVVQKNRYGGACNVCGFILPYYERGNLADYIGLQKELGALGLEKQFKWARQVVDTLRHLNAGPAGFYSELKADNLLLNENEDIVFIDFEQMGNWITYSAPEIHYFEYLNRLADSQELSQHDRAKYKAILGAHERDWTRPDDIYDDPPHGYYIAWIRLDAKMQEAAEVYSLGKLLWCLFEGCADTRNSPLKAFRYDTGQEFPEFRRTPLGIQQLIANCTLGSKDWEPGRIESVRRGARIYPRGRSGWAGEPEGTEAEAIIATKKMWETRVKEMEEYLQVQLRVREMGVASLEDERLLGYYLRPTLAEVAEVLLAEERKAKVIP